MLYTVVVTHRTRITQYRPVFEDWLCHVFLPFLSYLALATSGVAFSQYMEPALVAVAAATLVLLFVGIHNAWDTVTFIATGQLDQSPAAGESKDRASP